MKNILYSLALLFVSLSGYAQSYDKNEVYAVFTYRFTKMTEHPSTGDYKIVVFGNKDVAERMQKFHNSVSNGRKIIIIDAYKPEDAKGAAMIFIGDGRSGKINEIIEINPTAMIVTERNNMFSKGSHISFIQNHDKIAFEVSKSNSETKGIKLSKEILTFAKRVE